MSDPRAWRCKCRRHDEVVILSAPDNDPPTCLYPVADYVCSFKLEALDAVSLARITIGKHGAAAREASVVLAKAVVDGAHARDSLRSQLAAAEAENTWLRERFEALHPSRGSRPDDLTVTEEKLSDLAEGVTRLKLDTSDPETRAVWETALEAKREVASWPAWKRGDDHKKVP